MTPAQLARAAVEGVVCNLLAAADALGQPATDGSVSSSVEQREARRTVASSPT